MKHSLAEIIADAHCGKLSRVCCMSRIDFLWVVDYVQGMDLETAGRLYSAACMCLKPQPTEVNAAAVEACYTKFHEKMCTNRIMTMVVIADDAIALVLMAAKALPPPVQTTLLATWVALEGWKQACLTRTIPEALITGLCHVWKMIGDAKDSILEAIGQDSADSLFGSVDALITDSEVNQWITECCITGGAQPPLQLPPIAADPVAWAAANNIPLTPGVVTA